MLRALTALCGLLFLLSLAACGGDDDDATPQARTTPSAVEREEDREEQRERSASEFRGEANDLCDRFNLALVRRTKLPATRAQERRVLRRVFVARLKLLARLAHVDGPKAQKRDLRRAIR